MNENTFQLGWFQRDGDVYLPMPLAQSLWRADQIHGVAVSGLLARALEQAVAAAGRVDLVPARYHVDLFRPARMIATSGPRRRDLPQAVAGPARRGLVRGGPPESAASGRCPDHRRAPRADLRER